MARSLLFVVSLNKISEARRRSQDFANLTNKLNSIVVKTLKMVLASFVMVSLYNQKRS
jgi:hypothetical protein